MKTYFRTFGRPCLRKYLNCTATHIYFYSSCTVPEITTNKGKHENIDSVHLHVFDRAVVIAYPHPDPDTDLDMEERDWTEPRILL